MKEINKVVHLRPTVKPYLWEQGWYGSPYMDEYSLCIDEELEKYDSGDMCMDPENLLLCHLKDFHWELPYWDTWCNLTERDNKIAKLAFKRATYMNYLIPYLKEYGYDAETAKLKAEKISLVAFIDFLAIQKDIFRWISCHYDDKRRVLATVNQVWLWYIHKLGPYIVRHYAEDIDDVYDVSMQEAEGVYLEKCFAGIQKLNKSRRVVKETKLDEFSKNKNAFQWKCPIRRFLFEPEYVKSIYIHIPRDKGVKCLEISTYWNGMWRFYGKGGNQVWQAYSEHIIQKIMQYTDDFEKAVQTVNDIVTWLQSNHLIQQGEQRPSKLPMLCFWYVLPMEETCLYELLKRFRGINDANVNRKVKRNRNRKG